MTARAEARLVDQVGRAITEQHAFVYRVAYRVLHHAADAEDVCQEVFVRLLRAESRVFDPAYLRSWLARVAIRQSLNRIRADGNRRRREAHYAANVRRARTKGETVADAEAVQREIDRLPARLRIPLTLHYHEGMKYREVARVLGCPEGTVAKRLSLAKQRLRERLASTDARRGAVAIAPAAIAGAFDLESLIAQPAPIQPPVGLAERLQDAIRQSPSNPPASRGSTASQSLVDRFSRARWWIVLGAFALLSAFTVYSKYDRWLHRDGVAAGSRESLALHDSSTSNGIDAATDAAIANDSAQDGIATDTATAPAKPVVDREPWIRGTAFDDDGERLVGVKIEMLRGGVLLHTTKTDGFGEYRIPHIPLPPTESASGRDVAVVANPPTSRGVRTRSAATQSAITQIGGGIAMGLRRPDTGSSRAPRSATRSRIVDGLLSFRATRAGFVAAAPRSLSATTTSGPIVVDFVLEPAVVLDGWVVDERGQGIDGVDIAVIATTGIAGFGSDSGTVTTNESGYFRFTRLRLGIYALRARRDGFLDDVIIAVPGDEHRITLTGAVELSLRVLDHRGEPAPDIEVEVDQATQAASIAITDASGLATLTRLAAGRATLRAKRGSATLHQSEVDIAPRRNAERTIRLIEPAMLTVSIHARELGDLASVRLGRVGTANANSRRPTTTSPSNDVFTFEDLEPGDYELVVLEPIPEEFAQRLLAVVAFHIEAAASIERRIDLARIVTRRIAGRAQLDAVGDSPPYLLLRTRGQSFVAARALTESGAFEFGVPPGRYELYDSVSRLRLAVDVREHDASDLDWATTIPSGADTSSDNRAEPLSAIDAGFAPRAFVTFKEPMPLAVYLQFIGMLATGGIDIEAGLPGDPRMRRWIRPAGGPPADAVPRTLAGLGLAATARAGRVFVTSAR